MPRISHKPADSNSLRALSLLALICVSQHIHGQDDNSAASLGVDYAYLFLMTLSPDFAAANYTFDNEDGSTVDVSIGRLPYHIDLLHTDNNKLQLELAFAYQHTTELVLVAGAPGNTIDTEWNTFGAGAGLLYEQQLTSQLYFTPSLRFGIARMQNDATYHGPLAAVIRDAFEGTLFNWHTNASILNLGLGISYHWQLIDRDSSIKANVYHINVDSFNESNAAIKFSESANMLAVQADMIFPTDTHFFEERVDFVLLLGSNYYFGENRRTLGYTTSYQAGLGAEVPVIWKTKKIGYLRLSGQVLWADNMDGWLVTIGYNPDTKYD